MKQGTTQALAIELDIDLALAETIIFTIKGKNDKTSEILLQKAFPQNTIVIDKKIYINFTQKETELFPSFIFIEGQINFKDKSVGKTNTIRKFVDSTLFTGYIEGNTPNVETSELISLSVGEVLTINGATFTPFQRLIEGDKLELSWENDKGFVNPATVIITAPTGEKGLQGKDGVDYILTEQDKQDIAGIIGVEFPTNTSLNTILIGGEQP